MNKWLALFVLLSIMSNQVSAKADGPDLTPMEYNSIEKALLRGDEGALPGCIGDTCPYDMSLLLKAASFRIGWNLAASLKAAKRCVDHSSVSHTLTNYTCARLVNSDSENLYGYYGYWSSIEVLANSIRRGYQDNTWSKLWNVKSPASSNPVIKSSESLKRYEFEKSTISYINAVNSIPIVGDGSAKKYELSPGEHVNIKPVVNYPSVYVKINGETLLMLIDTGASTTSLHASVAKRLGVVALNSFDGGETGITGARYQDKVGVVSEFDFSGITFRNVIMRISNNEIHSLDDGTIGLDVLDKLPPFVLTKNALQINPNLPEKCNQHFTISSDLYSAVYGIAATGSRFNGSPAVAVLDTGNAAAAISPTWGMVRRNQLPVSNQTSGFSSASDGLHKINSGQIKGSLDYLGRKYSGVMFIGANYNNNEIDFNIGMPYFYGKKLYINFRDMKMCIFK